MSLVLLDEHRRDYGSDVIPGRKTEKHVRRTVRTHIRRGAVLVAEKEGRLVGFVLVSRARFVLDTSRTTGAITDIYVEPDERRRGIGSRLLASALEWLKARGYVRVLLNVSTNNPARRLYERVGFRSFSESMEIELD